MSTENAKFTPPTTAGVELTVEAIKDWPQGNEAQRNAHAALWNVSNTLSGLDTVTGWGLREEFCQRYGRVSSETKKAKAKGGMFTFGSQADFVKSGIKPPLIAPLLEAADHVYKLRKLAILRGEDKLAVSLERVKKHHDEKYSGLAV